MKWVNNRGQDQGATMKGHAFYGKLTCGHARIIACHADDAIPTDVPCPVCDEGRSVPKGWVWNDSADAAVDMRPPKPRKPQPDKAALMERSARFLAALEPGDIKTLLDGDPRLGAVLAMAEAARRAVAEEAAEREAKT